REAQARLGDLTFTAIDTAGLEEAAPETLTARMQEQTEAAIAAADAVMFLVDAREGSTPADRAFADLVRKSGKPAILIANKSEGRAGEAGVLEAYELGLGEPIAISAEHGEGFADLFAREGRALVIGMNKCDLVERRPGAMKRLREEADHWLPQVKGMPVVAVSGLTGEGLDRLMQAVVEAHGIWNRRVGTSTLNRWLGEVIASHPPPAASGRRIRLDYITQPKSRPPSFVLFTSRADALPDAYRRYLVNSLRETFDLPGTPIRLALREKKNPYAKRGKR